MEEKNIGFELKTINNLLKRKIENEISANEEMTRNHGYILCFLYQQKEKDIFQKDIEIEFSIRRSTATEILNLMEKNGLIKRMNYKRDARLKKILLTEKGLQMHQQTYNKIQIFEQKLKNNLTKEEIEKFFSILDKIKNNINNV